MLVPNLTPKPSRPKAISGAGTGFIKPIYFNQKSNNKKKKRPWAYIILKEKT